VVNREDGRSGAQRDIPHALDHLGRDIEAQ
jgi:hypothetical protein